MALCGCDRVALCGCDRVALCGGTERLPLSCLVCDKSFKHASRLRSHLRRVHSTHRPHACHVCNKVFSDPGNLKAHARIHAGLRPHRCQVYLRLTRSESRKQSKSKVKLWRRKVPLYPSFLELRNWGRNVCKQLAQDCYPVE